MSLPTAFICGVTGTQGGATARYLIAQGAKIHALARDPASDKAKAVEKLGMKLWKGDYDNEAALAAAMQGCTSAFLNLMPSFQDMGAELRQAKNIIQAAKDAGVRHLVYSSGLPVSAPEKLPHWDPKSPVGHVLLTKQAVEGLVREAGFPQWTILRPGNFMCNFLPPLVKMQYVGLVETGLWRTAFTPETVLPMVATQTIGAFGGSAILNPAKFNRQEVEYADELLKLDELLAKISGATERDLKAEYIPDEEALAQLATNPFVGGQVGMRNLVQYIDMEQVKTWGVPLSTFDAFLEGEKESFHETYNKSS